MNKISEIAGALGSYAQNRQPKYQEFCVKYRTDMYLILGITLSEG
jgi:hypothetical protein